MTKSRKDVRKKNVSWKIARKASAAQIKRLQRKSAVKREKESPSSPTSWETDHG